MKNTIKASEMKKGTMIFENDGFMWEVIDIVKQTPKTITVKIKSEFSSYKSHWDGIDKTFKKTSVLYGQN
jgi:hypothetical protein